MAPNTKTGGAVQIPLQDQDLQVFEFNNPLNPLGVESSLDSVDFLDCWSLISTHLVDSNTTSLLAHPSTAETA